MRPEVRQRIVICWRVAASRKRLAKEEEARSGRVQRSQAIAAMTMATTSKCSEDVFVGREPRFGRRPELKNSASCRS